MATEIVVILDDVRSAHNVGAILRSCDVFGVQTVYCCGITPYPHLENDTRLPHVATRATRQISKVSLGAEKTVAVHHAADITAVISELTPSFQIIAVEQDERSQPIKTLRPKSQVALVLGNEVSGVAIETRAIVDAIVEIPQLGQKESLNVSAAAAIALYHFSSV